MLLQREAWGPSGNPACHLSLREITERWRQLPREDADLGHIVVICQRLPDGRRETPEAAQLDREQGLVGDGWYRRPPREPQAQLAVMNHQLAQLLANGQPVTHSGDNLYVSLDISAGNLPTGTRLQVGDAQVSVSPKPHNGCAKFHDRFGADALRFVQASASREQNLRGIYWMVIEPGRIWSGAPIRVLARGEGLR